MTIGERIKARRLELNLSVDELANKLNKNRATIYRYESNEIENMAITVLSPLAEALETTPAFLMGWENKEEKIQNMVENLIIKNGIDPNSKEGKQEVLEIFEMALKKPVKKFMLI